MPWFEPLQWLMCYYEPAIFVGAFLFGETVIIAASFLAAQGWWSLQTVFWLSLVGTIISDCIWFFCGSRAVNTRAWKKRQRRYARVIHFIEEKTNGRPYLALIPIKFLYGTRILTIIYLSLHRVKFWLFLAVDILATIALLIVVIFIGWLAGRGYASAVGIYHNVSYALAGLLALYIVYKLISVWLSRRVINHSHDGAKT